MVLFFAIGLILPNLDYECNNKRPHSTRVPITNNQQSTNNNQLTRPHFQPKITLKEPFLPGTLCYYYSFFKTVSVKKIRDFSR